MLSHTHLRKLILVILITCGAQLALANYLPTDAQAPTIIPFTFNQVQENQRTSVLCTISSGDLPVTINWLKDGQPLTSSIAQAKRITIKPDSDQSTLKFNSVRLEHAGNYTCVAKNRAGLQAHSTQLVVHGEPRWISELKLDPVVATRGQTVVIDCQTTGWPRPTQTWEVKSHKQADFVPLNTLANGRISLAPNGSLIIRDADKADEANYLCKSTNGIGRGLSWSTSLKVTVPAHFGSNKQPAHVVRRQNPANLRCDAYGDEPITIEWFKNRTSLAGDIDPRYTIYNKPISNGLISQLVIRQSQRSDNSIYECITRNQAGKDRQPIELIVQEEPDNIQELQATQIGSRSVTLVWAEPYDGKSSIISYTFQYKRIQEAIMVAPSSLAELDFAPDSSLDAVKPASTIPDDWQQAQRILLPVPPANSTSGASSGQTRTVTIDKLEPSSKYVLRALAINAIGPSKFSQPMEFTTDEEAPEMGPTGIKAIAINSTSIQVSWDEVPKNKQFGRIHGYYVGYRVAAPNSAAPSNFIYKPYIMNDLLQPQQTIGSVSQASGPSNLSQVRLETIIHDLRRDTSYEITVVAFNSRGSGPSSDYVVCKTIEMDAPKPVKLSIRRESNDTIYIEWQRDPLDQNPVDDYTLHQEKNSASQERLQVRLPGNQPSYKASSLKCGTRYVFRVTAHNKVGDSQQSNIVSASTIGSLPAVPSKSNLIKLVNNTCLQVNLNSFQDGGCRVRTFTVRYRVEKSSSVNGSPSPIVGSSTSSAANHQAAVSGSSSLGSSHVKTLGSSANVASSNNLASSGPSTSEWITIRPKSNTKQMRANEEDRMEYLCDLDPNGEYTIHVAAANDVGRSEAEYTVLMSSDELRRSFVKDLVEFMANLPSVFAIIPSIMVFLLAGLLVSIVGLILHASVIKYHQKFVIIHNQMRAARRTKQDEKRRRKLNSSRQSQKLDLWAEEYEEGDGYDDEDDDDDTGGSAVMDDGYDEDDGTDISGGSSVRMHTAARHPRRFAKLANSGSSGHYVSNIGNMAFDSSSVDSHTQGKMSGGSTCMSSASPDSQMGRFRCLNSKQYVKMNEYSVLPTTGLSPAMANSIYGTTASPATGASPQSSQQTLSSAALSAQNQHSLYYSTLRRTNMQTYLPNRRQHPQQLPPQQHSHQRRSQNLAHSEIYGYYMGPPAAGPTGAAPSIQSQMGSRSPADSHQSAQQQAANVAANSIFVPPQQVIYSSPSMHGQPVFL